MSTLEDQFYFVKNHVQETVTEWGKNQTPCHYGNMFMLRLPLSGFLGQSPDYVRRIYRSHSRKFKVTDVVESANVPLLIQENRIKKERNPRRREALERQHNKLKRDDIALLSNDFNQAQNLLAHVEEECLRVGLHQNAKKTKKQRAMDEAMQRIAQRCTPDRGVRALRDKHEVTHLYELKIVAERFRTTVFNWDEEAYVFTRSHLQVLVNLCEYKLDVRSITAAIDYVGQQIEF